MPSVVAGLTGQELPPVYDYAEAITPSGTKNSTTLLNFDAVMLNASLGSGTATVSLAADTSKDTQISLQNNIIYPMKVRYVTAVTGFGGPTLIGLRRRGNS